ncbi:isoprenylcysteine carboxylmethyltransferase family protein [Pseudoalteromonas sp. DL2-H2.2]|uniref:methyltransferase family protein n=1 Tax=Pseudoalteromonas sp. DL2-H2.2 TaxID=2908889 RepID=UPI001F281F4B|nr:isoprenylcysteine carboxylmethyltransferase family protein [Pseudoalteromonas sp. DL2-H2.2]MCF2909603.1 isoprenylcysteine carboxylmethyltransferase family protein [Pseudoalteromonas sp. DL2-H2.2]
MSESQPHPLDTKIPPLVVLLLHMLLSWGLVQVIGYVIVAESFKIGGALVLSAIGIVVALAGVWAFRRHNTSVDPVHVDKASTLVTGGVYHFTRNPMYVGFLCLLIAQNWYLGSPAGSLAVLSFIAYMTRFQIKPEERFLLKTYGQAYRDFLSTTRRWL